MVVISRMTRISVSLFCILFLPIKRTASLKRYEEIKRHILLQHRQETMSGQSLFNPVWLWNIYNSSGVSWWMRLILMVHQSTHCYTHTAHQRAPVGSTETPCCVTSSERPDQRCVCLLTSHHYTSTCFGVSGLLYPPLRREEKGPHCAPPLVQVMQEWSHQHLQPTEAPPQPAALLPGPDCRLLLMLLMM